MSSGESKRRLDALLAAFGKETGATSLATEDNGVCILVFDGQLHINLLADPSTDHLVVWSNLGTLPAQSAEPVLRKLMQANLFWQGTEGATLGLMPASNDIVLAIRRPLDGLEVAGLSDLIELMIGRAETLSKLVAGGAEPAQPATDSQPARFGGIRG